MSWNAWLDFAKANKFGNKCAHEVAIFSLNGDVWAKTDGFPSLDKDNDGNDFFSSVKKCLDKKSAADVGKVFLNGDKFFLIGNVDDDTIVGKCGGESGFSASKAKSCYVIGYFKGSDVQINNNKDRVIETRNKLQESGY